MRKLGFIGLLYVLIQMVAVAGSAEDWHVKMSGWAEYPGEYLLQAVPAGAAGVTVSSRFVLQESVEAGREIWLAGLTGAAGEPADFVGLRWAQDNSAFLPLWRLEIVLPALAQQTENNKAAPASITALSTVAPQAGHEYAASFSYNDAGLVAVLLADLTTGDELYSAHLQAAASVVPGYAVTTGWLGEEDSDLKPGFHLQDFQVAAGYRSFGLPYALVKYLNWQLLFDPGTSEEQIAGKYMFTGQKVGVRLTWPGEGVSGLIRLSATCDGRIIDQVDAEWTPAVRTTSLAGNLSGRCQLRLTYVEAAGQQVIATQDVEVYKAQINVGIAAEDRRWLGPEGGELSGLLRLGSLADVKQAPLRVEAHMRDHTGQETVVGVLDGAFDLTAATSLLIPFSLTPAVQAQSVRFVVRAGDPAILLQVSGDQPVDLPPVVYTLPPAALQVDFEADDERTAVAQGVAGSRGLIVASTGAPFTPYLTAVAPERLPAEVGALTVSGWVRDTGTMVGTQDRALLSIPGLLTLYVSGSSRGRLRLELANRQQIWNSGYTTYLVHDRWVFFAISYDGRRQQDNVAVYIGTEEGPVDLEQMASAGGDPLKPRASEVIVGAANRSGAAMFAGALDDLRVYASHDSSAALTRAQIEAVRKSALGAAWSQSQAEQAQNQQVRQAAHAQSLREKYWSAALNAEQVEVLDWVYPDRAPEVKVAAPPPSTPRGSAVPLQFAVMSRYKGVCRMEVTALVDAAGAPLAGAVRTYRLLPVMVEANNNGGGRTSVASRPPQLWLEQFTRVAPCYTYEPLVPAGEMAVEPGVFYAVLVDVAVAAEARPGVYNGQIVFTMGEQRKAVPFSIVVHETVVPAAYRLHATHWLQPDPENLTNVSPPPWWSERHWELLAQAGGQLRLYGDDTLYTPLIDGAYPLIQASQAADGTYSFDFTRFDRWVETFSAQGFVYFAGHHLLNMTEIRVLDAATGRIRTTISPQRDQQAWLEMLPAFLPRLHQHLLEMGWADKYLQHVLDEPRDAAIYRQVSNMVKTYMPGIRTIDAVNSSPATYSPLVDIHVFSIGSLTAQQALVARRAAEGKINWVYHCASPYPPAPNTHLDERLTNTRLYPWLAFLYQAEGYLYWAANNYRGANPYITSIGPVPSGSQNPGHAPGDNWFFYPGPEGLRGSLRIVAFREGLLDHTLLAMLAEKEPDKAGEIAGKIARSLTDYATDPAAYHAARTELLDRLDRYR